MDIININNLLAEGLVTTSFTSEDFLIIIKRDLTPGGDGYKQFAIPATALGGGGSAQTLAQTLAFGNTTGETNITSDNGFSIHGILDAVHFLSFNNGLVSSDLLLSPLQVGLYFSDGFINSGMTMNSFGLSFIHNLFIEFAALQNIFNATDNIFPNETASSLAYFDASKNLKPIVLGTDLTLTGNILDAKFTGNTFATCITDIFVTNINSCSPLHIQPTALGDVYIVENGGSVGIGTISPTGKLHIKDASIAVGVRQIIESEHFDASLMLNTFSNGASTSGGSSVSFQTASVEVLKIGTNTANSNALIESKNGYNLVLANAQATGMVMNFFNTGPAVHLQISNNSSSLMILSSTGNLGIGTSFNAYALPTARLHVQGISNISSDFALKVDGIAPGTPLLYVTNNGLVSINQTSIGAARLEITGGAFQGIYVQTTASIAVNANDTSGIAVKGEATTGVGLQGNIVGSVGYALKLNDTAGGGVELMKVGSNGTNSIVNIVNLQVGPATLVAGDLYKDTAANILAAGDYVIGMKA